MEKNHIENVYFLFCFNEFLWCIGESQLFYIANYFKMFEQFLT